MDSDKCLLIRRTVFLGKGDFMGYGISGCLIGFSIGIETNKALYIEECLYFMLLCDSLFFQEDSIGKLK